MQSARGSWADVQAGTYIKDRNDKTWYVLMLSDDRVRLRDRSGTEVDIRRPIPTREVEMLWPTDGEARYTLQSALGAMLLATKDETGYHCPKSDCWDLSAARWHLHRFHRIDATDMSLDEIKAVHLTDHGPVDHDHTENA